MLANQLKLSLAFFAYVPVRAVRRVGLADTKLAAVTRGTIRRPPRCHAQDDAAAPAVSFAASTRQSWPRISDEPEIGS